jgi:hypothetical protein
MAGGPRSHYILLLHASTSSDRVSLLVCAALPAGEDNRTLDDLGGRSGVASRRHYSQAKPVRARGRRGALHRHVQLNNRLFVANGLSPLDATLSKRRSSQDGRAGVRTGACSATRPGRSTTARSTVLLYDTRPADYEGVLPGSTAGLARLAPGHTSLSSRRLEERGHETISPGLGSLLSTEPPRPESDSVSAFVR